jgi:chromosome segregation ATPase
VAEPFASNGNGGEVSHLEARYRHLDDRVGRLSQDVAGISATLAQVSHTLESISHKVNTPTRTEWSAIVAGCAFVASLGYSALMPVKERIAVHSGALSAISDRHREFSSQLGQVDALKQTSAIEHARTHETIDAVRVRVRNAEQRISAAEARAEMLAERVRDVDMAGSRKWVRDGK